MGHELPRREARGAAALRPTSDMKTDCARGRDWPRPDERDDLYEQKMPGANRAGLRD